MEISKRSYEIDQPSSVAELAMPFSNASLALAVTSRLPGGGRVSLGKQPTIAILENIRH
jgi:hypothetical protein